MLSDKERKELLEDAKSTRRRRDFRLARASSGKTDSIDEYFRFLQSIQDVFTPFDISTSPTITKFNKL